ncbi:MAG: metal-dependent transcriptional regulator [Flavobacteriales bacterium]|nr:MAG: metal-dependent transcriptional regulator [Flavobacteriales bacterium]
MHSQAEENYLKAIHSLQNNPRQEVSTTAMADKMQTNASSVTEMFRKLAGKDLVHYRKYRGVQLTQQGKAMAISIVRKHRLWETFLVEKLNFSWEEVHDIAEQLEHIQSEVLTNRLEHFLGYPKYDPHGDPIPSSKGELLKVKGKRLTELKIEEEGVLINVKDSSEEFLKYLNKKNLGLGDRIKVIAIEPFDKSIKIDNKTQEHVISEQIAKNLYLK